MKSKNDNTIVVDIGNTSVSVALARKDKIARVSRLPTGHLDKRSVAGIINSVMNKRRIAASVLCSVVPSATPIWRAELKRAIGVDPLVVSHKLTLGVRIAYPRPETIGSDRLANACVAASRYKGAVIVADFGTALTFDVLIDNTYVGGVIAPGLPLMTDYLAEKTALLPRIRLRGRYGEVGKTTVEAMRIGAKVGYRGMVREIVAYLMSSLGIRKVKLCATGGYARWALEDADMPFEFDPNLTLYGLNRIYKLNLNYAGCGVQEKTGKKRPEFSPIPLHPSPINH